MGQVHAERIVGKQEPGVHRNGAPVQVPVSASTALKAVTLSTIQRGMGDATNCLCPICVPDLPCLQFNASVLRRLRASFTPPSLPRRGPKTVSFPPAGPQDQHSNPTGSDIRRVAPAASFLRLDPKRASVVTPAISEGPLPIEIWRDPGKIRKQRLTAVSIPESSEDVQCHWGRTDDKRA